jgi:Mlc titration factor MtfA (ptsG expression regulator)
MIFSWLKARRRAGWQAEPFPSDWRSLLESRVAQYAALSSEERQQLEKIVQVFLREKNWEGCNGLRLNDEIRVVISALACLLLLGWRHDYFANVLSVLVYPTDYRVPAKHADAGVVLESEDARHGEAWYRGPVVLSWQEIEEDLANPWDGQNLVLHEFAHQLDFLDREANGTPPLATRELAARWQQVMTSEYKQLLQATRRGRPTLIDSYGTTNEAEFFAVVTECFFTTPWPMRQEHPDLYALLRDFYHQDPAQWKVPHHTSNS